jgi:hypothetical protein
MRIIPAKRVHGAIVDDEPRRHLPVKKTSTKPSLIPSRILTDRCMTHATAREGNDAYSKSLPGKAIFNFVLVSSGGGKADSVFRTLNSIVM